MTHYLKEMPTSSYMANYNKTGSTAVASSGTHYTAPADLTGFSDAEIQFRQDLIKGDLIDVVYHDLNYSMEGWVKGEIVSIIGDPELKNLGDEAGNRVKRFDIKYKHHKGTKLLRADSR